MCIAQWAELDDAHEFARTETGG
eukprot:COSAG02_NODE_53758_length_300_cov_0.343284_1_plen_22_part_10